jgi:hypothetical protein
MSEKIYVGSGKKAEKFDIVNISVCLTDIPKDKIKKADNGKSYVNLVVVAKKEVDKYGKSHYVAIDDYKGGNNSQSSDLPF